MTKLDNADRRRQGKMSPIVLLGGKADGVLQLAQPY